MKETKNMIMELKIYSYNHNSIKLKRQKNGEEVQPKNQKARRSRIWAGTI